MRDLTEYIKIIESADFSKTPEIKDNWSFEFETAFDINDLPNAVTSDGVLLDLESQSLTQTRTGVTLALQWASDQTPATITDKYVWLDAYVNHLAQIGFSATSHQEFSSEGEFSGAKFHTALIPLIEAAFAPAKAPSIISALTSLKDANSPWITLYERNFSKFGFPTMAVATTYSGKESVVIELMVLELKIETAVNQVLFIEIGDSKTKFEYRKKRLECNSDVFSEVAKALSKKYASLYVGRILAV